LWYRLFGLFIWSFCMSESFFANIPAAMPDPILGVAEAFRADPHQDKVNLGVGVYQDNDGRTPILQAIQQATRIWTAREDTKSYLTIDGVQAYNTGTQELLFGANSPVLRDKRAMTMQSVASAAPRALGRKKEAIAPPPNFNNDRRFNRLMPSPNP
jgi:aspartate/tyrosine/aromatic aminotransferase